MPTLPVYLGVTQPPLNGDGKPETMPYAVDGTTIQPGASRENTGWVAGVLPPASEENWMRQKLWQWMSRLSGTAAFTTRATVSLTLGGTPAVGDTLTVDYNGDTDTYVVTGADVIGGLSTIAANWAQQIELNAVLRLQLDASDAGAVVLLAYKLPGNDFVVTPTASATGGVTVAVADVIGGAGQPFMVTTAPGEGTGIPLLHGVASPTGAAAAKLHYYGNANEGALRSGSFGSTQANPANVGQASLGVGKDVSAFGDYATATGNLSQASAVGSVAMGLSNLVVASADASVALGDSNEIAASSTTSIAAGLSNTINAGSVSTIAMGEGNTVTGVTQVVLGHSNTVANTGHPSSIAIGDTNSITTSASACAIGTNNTINSSSDGAFAIGTGHIVGKAYALALGLNAKPNNPAEMTLASGQFAAPGDAQSGHIVTKATETATSTNYLVPDGGVETLNMPSLTAGGSVYAVELTIVAQWVSGSSGSIADKAYWKLSGVAFIASTGVVTLAGFASSPIAPTHSAGLGNQYRVNLTTASNTLEVYGVTSNAAATARFVGHVFYVAV